MTKSLPDRINDLVDQLQAAFAEYNEAINDSIQNGNTAAFDDLLQFYEGRGMDLELSLQRFTEATE